MSDAAAAGASLWSAWCALPRSPSLPPAVLAETLDGGQAFRWQRQDDGTWLGLWAEQVVRLRLDPHVTVHSLRVTALTTARERGSDIIDLQDFAGHADPRTTLTYIRNRDRLSNSPAYLLRYGA